MSQKPRKTTPEPMVDREILNIDGAAAFLGVSVKTFSKVLREGDVPARKVGREWKFSRQALIEWVGGSRSRAFLDALDDEGSEPAARTAASARRSTGAGGTGGAGAGRNARGAASGRARAGGNRVKPVDDFSVDEL